MSEEGLDPEEYYEQIIERTLEDSGVRTPR